MTFLNVPRQVNVARMRNVFKSKQNVYWIMALWLCGWINAGDEKPGVPLRSSVASDKLMGD